MLKLTIEPIPRTSAGKSLSKLLRGRQWDRIRERVYAAYGHRCAVCGTERKDRRLDCHEEWEYDEAASVQKLSRLVALCLLCHRVKHMSDHWNWVVVPYGPCGPRFPALSNQLEAIVDRRENELRQRFITEEAAKPRVEQRFWSDDPEGWPERYRRELEERSELAGNEEARRWLKEFDRVYHKTAIEHFVEVNHPVPLAILEEHILAALRIHEIRSRDEWRIDFGEFA